MLRCYVGYDSNRVLGGATSVKSYTAADTIGIAYPKCIRATRNQPRLSGGALGLGGSGGIGLFPFGRGISFCISGPVPGV